MPNIFEGLVLGDACGAGYEFAGSRVKIAATLDLTQYVTNPNEDYTVPPGGYTDDTQMSIAIMELLLSGAPLTVEAFAEHFVKVFQRDPINGYARRFQKFLEEHTSGKAFMEDILATSTKNGAAMRALPLGYLPTESEVLYAAKINAQVTHNTEEGIFSSQGIALMAHGLLYNKIKPAEALDHAIEKLSDQKALTSYLQIISDTKSDAAVLGPSILKGVQCDGVMTLGAVGYILQKFHTSTDILRESILLGGDVDSVAGLALGLFGAQNELSDLPQFLTKDVRNDTYGLDFVIRLGNQLDTKYGL